MKRLEAKDIFKRISEGAKHPKTRTALENIKSACDFIDSQKMPITRAGVAHYCKGRPGGPTHGTLHNNKEFQAYIEARRVEHSRDSTANAKDPLLQVFGRYFETSHDWVMGNHSREFFAAAQYAKPSPTAKSKKPRYFDVIALIDLAIWRSTETWPGTPTVPRCSRRHSRPSNVRPLNRCPESLCRRLNRVSGGVIGGRQNHR